MDIRHPFAEALHNGRPEENGNSQPMDSEEMELYREAEMIQKRLIETAILERLKEFMVRKLSTTDWKDKMFSICKDILKGSKENNDTKISFDQLYDTLKEAGKNEVNEELKMHVIHQMKISYDSL